MAKINYVPAIGRRKKAIARVRVFRGKEPLMINGIAASTYFPGLVSQKLLEEPLRLAELLDKYTATVKVVGSGQASQLQAVIHGLARAIIKLDNKFKPKLKAAGLLRRDPRKKQRRMVGTGGKSRRRKQSPKR